MSRNMQVWQGPRLGSPGGGNCGCCGCLSQPNGDTVGEYARINYPDDPVGKAYPRFTAPARLELELLFAEVSFPYSYGGGSGTIICDWRDLNGIRSVHVPRSNFGCIHTGTPTTPVVPQEPHAFVHWSYDRSVVNASDWFPPAGMPGRLRYWAAVYREERFRYLGHHLVGGQVIPGDSLGWTLQFSIDPVFELESLLLPESRAGAWGHDAKRLGSECTGTIQLVATWLGGESDPHQIGTFASRIVRE